MIDPIQRLILELGRLPGVGQRSAVRLAHHIIKVSRTSQERGAGSLARDLAEALVCVDAEVRLCGVCQNLATQDTCPICTDLRRDATVLCVVESVADLRSIELSGFRGRYHVLHGALSPLDGVGPEALKLPALVERVAQTGITEVILATNANVEGDATAYYIARLLKPAGILVTRLASGVPLGGEIEYLDQATVGRALKDRRRID